MVDRATALISRCRGPDAEGEGGYGLTFDERARLRAELPWYPAIAVGFLALFALLWIATP